MQVEINASVYSVITQRAEFEPPVGEEPYGENQRLQAYLYDHTKIVESHGNDNYVYTIVKTTATFEVDGHTRKPVHSSDRDPIDEVFYLANYQLNRLGSGLIGGILAGSLREAQELLADVVVNS